MEARDPKAHVVASEQGSYVDRAENPGQCQTSDYSAAIGRGIPGEEVAELQEFLQDVQPFEKYDSHPEIRFIYEIMVKDEWRPRIRKTVNTWINVCEDATTDETFS